MLRGLLIASFFATPLAAQEFFTLKGHGGPVKDIAVSPTGQIATASFDNSVGLWNDGTPAWREGHRAAVNAVTFWNNEVLISGGDDYSVLFWPAETAGVVIGQHQAKVMGLAWSPKAQLVASASWDHTIGLWSLPNDTAQLTAGAHLKGHRQGVNDVAFSEDGTTLYSASTDGTIRVWDIAAKTSQVLVKHGFGINKIIATDDWIAYGAVDGGTRIVDAETGTQIADFTLDRRPVLAMSFHAPSGNLAVGDGQGYIMMIDTNALKITRDFRAARSGPIWALAFSPDGKNIHAGGIEDIMYSWPVDTLSEHAPMAGGTRSFLENPDTLPNGERQFKRKCSICHTLTEGSARKAGPSLHGVFGRQAGTVSDYSYSSTLNGSEIVWSAETIDALFDLGPDHYIPGTKMPMQRIVKQADRDDLVDYLRVATATKEN